MDILACSYENIGPFSGKPFCVSFFSGAYLIRAPIGSGKSFLFFDGPVFALYKYSGRPMLHRRAKKGVIECLFQISGEIYLIRRIITPTKSGGESVTSHLYHCSGSRENIEKILSGSIDHISLGYHCFYKVQEFCEEVVFSSQRELEGSLNDLLPPREALLAVNFLMQDAENVFELQSSQRITVFKHLFGLIGIDEAKDRLAEKRRELQATIRVLEHADDDTAQLQMHIETIRTFSEDISSYKEIHSELEGYISNLLLLPFFADLGLLKDIQIDNFHVEDEVLDAIDRIELWIEQRLQAYHRLEGNHDHMSRSLEQLMVQKKKLHDEKFGIGRTLERLRGLISDELEEEVEGLQKQLHTYTNSLQEQNVIPEHIRSYLPSTCTNLTDIVELVERKIQEGKEFMHQKELQGTHLTQLKERGEQLEKRIDEENKQLHVIEVSYESQTTFHCDKIEGSCPYVELIKGQGLRALQQQRERIQERIKNLEEEKTQLNVKEKIADIEKKIAEFQKNAQDVRLFLQNIDRKGIQEKYQKAVSIRQNRDDVQLQLTKLEKRIDEQESAKKELVIYEQKLLDLNEKEKDIILEENRLQQEKVALQQQVQEYQASKLTSLKGSLKKGKETILSIGHLVQNYKKNQLVRKQAIQEEKKIKELYTIFSKELLLVVLQDFLPQLEQAINSYLQQIVDYEVRFLLPSDQGDRIDLEIEVIDERGKRPVKSLSGGQKAVLKIAWILSVATIMRSSFLFLDETINSLDALTVGKVADVIEDFVKMREMKLYVVTHAPQIQDMDIWERVIHIQDALSGQ